MKTGAWDTVGLRAKAPSRLWGTLAVGSRPVLAWVALALCLCATVFATVHSLNRKHSEDQARFNDRVKAVQQGLNERMDSYVQLLRGAGGLLAVSPELDARQWRAYFEKLDLSRQYKGVQALGYIESVPGTNVESFVTSARRAGSGMLGLTNFQIWPVSDRDVRYVVKFVEPLENNVDALGYDIGSEDLRRDAAEQARDHGEPWLTRQIRFVQTPWEFGVLLLLPVYQGTSYPVVLAERRSRLQGWVYAAVQMEDLMAGLMELGGQEVGLEVYDGAEISTAAFLYKDHTRSLLYGLASFGTTELSRITKMQVGGRVWTLHFSTRPAFGENAGYSLSPFIGIGGLCISLLLFGIARSLATSEQRAVSLAEQMTHKLRLQERAIGSSNDGIVILAATKGYPIIYANPAFVKMMGYSPPELLGHDTTFLLRHEMNQPDVPRLMEALRAGHETRAILREYRKDGTQLWVDLKLSPVRDSVGKTTHFLAIIENITDRKHAQEQLFKAERRYQDLVNNLGVGVYRNTPGDHGRLIEVNPALLTICEAESKEELLQHSVSEFYAEPRERKDFMWRLLTEGMLRSQECQMRTVKGRLFWASISATRVIDEQGQVFFDGLLEDITERKRAEQAVRESQERFALAVQGTNDGLWDWNVLTDEVYFSPRWKSMLGYEDREIENTFLGWERLLHPEDRDRALAEIKAYFMGESPIYEVEHRLRHKDGSYRWILARGVVVRDSQGAPLRMAGSHLDLTERKQAEEQLRLANTELAQSQESLKAALEKLKASHDELKSTQLQLIQAAKLESVGTLAAGVAHEVKNPLQIVLLGLDYLDAILPPPENSVKRALTDMRDAVQRANAIVKELLCFSTAANLQLKEEDLTALAERALWLVNYEAEAASVRVVRDLASNLPPVLLDHGKLEQAMINVLLNAIQAMVQGGTLTVRTRCEKGSSNGDGDSPADLVVLEINDTGPGIPEEHLARVFDPFFTTKPVGLGTGLGLPIVKNIMELHGAGLEVRNLTDGGTSVRFIFEAKHTQTNRSSSSSGLPLVPEVEECI